MEKFRDRKFCLLLYPEDTTHMTALQCVKESYDCAIILHDKDVDENGEVKKPHYHVVITVGKNAIWNTALAKALGITENYIQQCRNVDRALEYLIHFNEPEKYQYTIEEVSGTLKDRLKQSVNSTGKTEGEKVMELMNFIQQYDGYLTITEFSKYACEIGMWDVYRRSAVIFMNIIKEHNAMLDQDDEY